MRKKAFCIISNKSTIIVEVKKNTNYIIAALVLGVIVIILLVVIGYQRKSILHLVKDIPLTGGANRLDYQTIDPTTNKLYISHLGSRMVHVIDLKTQKLVKDIPLTASPYGILAIPVVKEVYVGVGGNDQVAVIDEKTLSVKQYIDGGKTPDGIAYSPPTNKIFVSNENGGTVSVIDGKRKKRIADIRVGGSVGNTQFDPASRLIYSVSGDANTLVEIDPTTDLVLNTYPLSGCVSPHGLLIDRLTRAAFIACQQNNKMVVFDLIAKKIVFSDSVGISPDVIAYDEGLHHLYIAGEAGAVTIFSVNQRIIKKLDDRFFDAHAHSVAVDQKTHLVYFPLEDVSGKPVLRVFQGQL